MLKEGDPFFIVCRHKYSISVQMLRVGANGVPKIGYIVWVVGKARRRAYVTYQAAWEAAQYEMQEALRKLTQRRRELEKQMFECTKSFAQLKLLKLGQRR